MSDNTPSAARAQFWLDTAVGPRPSDADFAALEEREHGRRMEALRQMAARGARIPDPATGEMRPVADLLAEWDRDEAERLALAKILTDGAEGARS